MVMFEGTVSRSEMCHPAWSSRSTACPPGATLVVSSSRNSSIAAMLHQGRINPADFPSGLPSLEGQIAPKM